MRKVLLIAIQLLVLRSFSQNLVSNGSFENYSSCPTILGQTNLAFPWNNPTSNTPDFFHECNTGSYADVPYNNWGRQSTHSGSGYMGVATYYSTSNGREYISQQLSESLVSGITYYLEFYASLADTSSHATDGLGAHFSQNAIGSSDYFNLSFTPQIRQSDGVPIIDKTNWTKISGFYTATGGESYVTIGNFYPDSTTSIDTVSSSGTWVAYYYIDDVLLIPDSLVNVKAIDSVSDAKFSVYPNPSSGLFQVVSSEELVGLLKIYDLKGQMIMELTVNKQSSLDLSYFDSGVYFYHFNDGLSSRYGKLIISK